MPFGSSVLGIPPTVLNLIQEGLLERAFHDALVPRFLFRREALFEPFNVNSGTEVLMTRSGLLPVVTEPLAANREPADSQYENEQWYARIDRWGGRKDTHMPTSTVANSNLFFRNINQLGIQAAQTLNRLPRNALYLNYGSGQTLTTASCLTTDTTVHVASLNGFTDVVIMSTSARPVPVSSTNPLSVTLGTTTTATRNVVAAIPDSASDPFGPGTLQFSTTIGTAFSARTPVVAANAPRIIRAGGGNSVDSIASNDTVGLQDFINATAYLRGHSVEPHQEDGLYHAHIAPSTKAQMFTDPSWKTLFTAQPDHPVYQDGSFATIAGIKFFENNECPVTINSGALTSTGTYAKYAKDIGGEVVNESNVSIARTIVTGKGCLYELGLDESNYISEAGVNGKIGGFDVINNSLQITTERIRLVISAPIDVLADTVRAAWSITCGFPVPSDLTAITGSERYKRAVIIESAV